MKVGELPFNLHRRTCPWNIAASTSSNDPNSHNQSPLHRRPSPLTALLFEANDSTLPTPPPAATTMTTVTTTSPSPQSQESPSPQDPNATVTTATTTAPAFTTQRCTCPCSDSVKLVRDLTGGMDLELARWLTKCADFGSGHTSLDNVNAHDRQLLVCSAWKDIVILYMAQNKFSFNVVYAAMYEYIHHLPVVQQQQQQQQSSSCMQSYSPHHTGGVEPQFQVDVVGKPGMVPQTYLHPLRRGSDFGIPTMRTVNQLRFTLSKLDQMQLDSKEYAVLRILLLLNSDLHALTDSRAIEAASEKVHTALMEYETLKYPDDPLRLSHMLLLLPGVRGFSAAVFENLFYHHLIGDTSVASVLRELMLR